LLKIKARNPILKNREENNNARIEYIKETVDGDIAQVETACAGNEIAGQLRRIDKCP